MISLLQRVSAAEVEIGGSLAATIGRGLLVLACVEPEDTPAHCTKMAQRLASYRVFPDAQGRMNLNVAAADGQILLVPQFTLAADTRSGNRPSFSKSAPAELGKRLFAELAAEIEKTGLLGGKGTFGADMQVRLTNDGPVTFWLTV